jgi:L-2-hydroxyglutarate oxidase LhgO
LEEVDCIVAGAGVVGLAVARALALAGREVLILEKAASFGTETSARNSEVIHAGIYYPQGSLMARFCVAGRRALYAYLTERGLPHKRCGKLIVATNAAELDQLGGIRTRAAANGVDDLEPLTAAQAQALEPALACTGALLSPSTGIIDSHAYMLSLLGEAEAHGATLVCNTPVVGGRVSGQGIEIEAGGAEPMALRARLFINAAGLGAPALARRIEGLPLERIPGTWWAKGNYFTLAGRSPFSRLIYPVPVPGGLGTHLTLDLARQARFGPDVEWVEEIDYQVDPRRGESFTAAIRRYWPDLPSGALQPAYSGVRPKIVPPGAPGQDFVIEGPSQHGVAGVVNLFGIESPGLTSSLAIGGYVAVVAG